MEMRTEFNCIHKRMDLLYHNYAKQLGLSDAAFWALYSVYEHDGPCTQRDLCKIWFYAPQTINSALKSLVDKGFLTFEYAEGNQKNKQIFFTKAGEDFVSEKMEPLLQAEKRAFEGLNEKDRNRLLTIMEKHIQLLEMELGKINGCEK